MGCNTSSEAKPAKDEVKAEQNHKQAESENKEPAKEEQAATKIQAVFRGHQTRKSMSMKATGAGAAKQQQNQQQEQPTRAELEAEFRADDKELCSAATKIQASFRGHQSRKQVEQQEKEAKDKDKVFSEKVVDFNKRPPPPFFEHLPLYRPVQRTDSHRRYRPLTFYDEPPPMRSVVNKPVYYARAEPRRTVDDRFDDDDISYPYHDEFRDWTVEQRKVKKIPYHYLRRSMGDDPPQPTPEKVQPVENKEDKESTQFRKHNKDVECSSCLLKELLDPEFDKVLDLPGDPKREEDQTHSFRAKEPVQLGENPEAVSPGLDTEESNLNGPDYILIESEVRSGSGSLNSNGKPAESTGEEKPSAFFLDPPSLGASDPYRTNYYSNSPDNPQNIPDMDQKKEEEPESFKSSESNLSSKSVDQGSPGEYSDLPGASVFGWMKSVNTLRSPDKAEPVSVSAISLNANPLGRLDERYEENPDTDLQNDSKDLYFMSKDGFLVPRNESESSLKTKKRFQIHDALSPLEVHMPFHYKFVRMLIPRISPKHLNVLPECVNAAKKSARRLRTCHRNSWRKLTARNRVILNVPSHGANTNDGSNLRVPNDVMVLQTNSKPIPVKSKNRTWLSIFGADAERPHINSDKNEKDMKKVLENWTSTKGVKTDNDNEQNVELYGIPYLTK